MIGAVTALSGDVPYVLPNPVRALDWTLSTLHAAKEVMLMKLQRKENPRVWSSSLGSVQSSFKSTLVVPRRKFPEGDKPRRRALSN